MGIFKWITGLIGFMVGGPLGALAGFVFGYLMDDDSSSSATGGSQSYRQQGGTYTGGAQGQRESFLFSMLVLSSYIIRADGKVMHSEMEYVRAFLRHNFGDEAAQQGNEILLKLFEEEKRQKARSPYAWRDTIRQCAEQIAGALGYSERLQLLNYLVMIAQADGSVPDAERDALYEVAGYMRMGRDDVDSMLHLKSNSLDDAYSVLGISPSATDDEVKAAYRKKALEHHPDRVAKLGEDVRKAAEKKFQEINEAKERIYKARGL